MGEGGEMKTTEEKLLELIQLLTDISKTISYFYQYDTEENRKVILPDIIKEFVRKLQEI